MKLEEIILGMLEEIKRIEEVDREDNKKEDGKKTIKNLIKQRDELIVVANEKANRIEELEGCIEQYYRTKQVQEGIIVDKQSKIEEQNKEISQLKEKLESQAITISELLESKSKLLEHISKIYGLACGLSK